jgi:hypothetical protein
VFSVLKIELTESLGLNTYTLEPRLPPVAGAAAVGGVTGVSDTVKLVIDHQLVVEDAVSSIRMYCAVCGENVAVSGEEAPVPKYTGVKFVPSLETSTS